MDETYRVCPAEPFRLLARHGAIRRGCINRDGLRDAALEQTKCQRANTGSDIEQGSAQRSCLLNAFLEQARRGPRTLCPVAIQFSGRLFFIELQIRCALEWRAT